MESTPEAITQYMVQPDFDYIRMVKSRVVTITQISLAQLIKKREPTEVAIVKGRISKTLPNLHDSEFRSRFDEKLKAERLYNVVFDHDLNRYQTNVQEFYNGKVGAIIRELMGTPTHEVERDVRLIARRSDRDKVLDFEVTSDGEVVNRSNIKLLFFGNQITVKNFQPHLIERGVRAGGELFYVILCICAHSEYKELHINNVGQLGRNLYEKFGFTNRNFFRLSLDEVRGILEMSG